jgi:uncharacterized Zn finger protein
MGSRGDDRFDPRSDPGVGKGGVHARGRVARSGRSWWARRWLEVLEGFGLGAQLERGRASARRGQVGSLQVEKGVVRARVQGSRARPYAVTIVLEPFPRAAWDRLAEALSARAAYAAKLLAGELPADLEGVLAGVGLPLFPRRYQDLKTACTCPDWSRPCKHVAAACYLLAEAIDRDPFLLLRLRGLERDELVGLLGGGQGAERSRPAPEPAALPVEADAFWGRPPVGSPWALEPPERPAALLRRLGPVPSWPGERALVEYLAETYRKAGERGVDLVAGEEGPGNAD